MRKWHGLNDSSKISYPFWIGLAFLLLCTAPIWDGHAQSSPEQSEFERLQSAPTEAKPFIVERRKIVEGEKLDPRSRFELHFGEQREKCTTWRFEAWMQPDGHAVFELKEPADKKVLLDSQFSPQHIEFVLGDFDCNYRIRIERIK